MLYKVDHFDWFTSYEQSTNEINMIDRPSNKIQPPQLNISFEIIYSNKDKKKTYIPYTKCVPRSVYDAKTFTN